jgi:hypothetical protein
MGNKSSFPSGAAERMRAASHTPIADPSAGPGWVAITADLAIKFGPDVLMPASTTCAVIYYNRTEWPLLLFVFSVNCAFLAYRFMSRKSFGP